MKLLASVALNLLVSLFTCLLRVVAENVVTDGQAKTCLCMRAEG